MRSLRERLLGLWIRAVLFGRLVGYVASGLWRSIFGGKR